MKFNYMSSDGKILTSVSINNHTKKVRITNYTDEIMDRAFGVKENVTYQDVMDFFEGRTFPRNRADLQDILDCFGLKKYDPYLMCEKLQGKTEQDHEWIDFLKD